MRGSERRANIGQWLAFVLVGSGILAGVYSISQGQAGVGATIITVGFGGGIALVIAGAKQPPREAVRKAKTSKRGSARAQGESKPRATRLRSRLRPTPHPKTRTTKLIPLTNRATILTTQGWRQGHLRSAFRSRSRSDGLGTDAGAINRILGLLHSQDGIESVLSGSPSRRLARAVARGH